MRHCTILPCLYDLQSEPCDKSKLQLVGVTAMLIASKYEEMYAPEVMDFVLITDKTYTSEMIRMMERRMLKVLDYSFSNPLPLHFLRRYSRAGNVSSNFTQAHSLTITRDAITTVHICISTVLTYLQDRFCIDCLYRTVPNFRDA